MVSMFLEASREKVVAIADIASASTSVAIATLASGAPAQIAVCEERVLALDERKKVSAVAALGTALTDAAEATLKKYIEKNKRSDISEVWAIVHAPWSRSETTVATSKLDTGSIIAQHMIDKLEERVASEETTLDSKHIIETRVIRVELNGYTTARPIGKRAHELSIATLVSDCDAKIHAAATEVLAHVFSQKPQFRSFTYALLCAIPKIARDMHSFMLVDMTSEATGVTVVRDDLAGDHLVVNEGAHSIVRKIAGKGMPEETLSLMKMVFRDECEGEACDMLKKSIAAVEPDLVRRFGEGISELASKQRLPNTIFLTVMPDLSPWLAQFFSRIDFSQFTINAQPFVVHPLTPEALSEFAKLKNETPPDLQTILGAALVNKESAASHEHGVA